MPPEVLPNYEVNLQVGDGYLALGPIPVPPIGTQITLEKHLTPNCIGATVEVTSHEWDVRQGIGDDHLPITSIRVRTKPVNA
jgi:hypothetical protein